MRRANIALGGASGGVVRVDGEGGAMRKVGLVFCAGVLVTACGTETTVVDCTVTEADSCAVIVCPNGDPVTVCDGADGQDGAQGDTGAQGPPGENGQDGAQGATGAQGPPGQPGQDGAPGAVTSVTYLDFEADDNVNVPPGGSEDCVVDGLVAVDAGEGVLLLTTFRNQGLVDSYFVYLRVSADGATPGDPITSIPIPSELTGPTWNQKFTDAQFLEGWEGDLYLHVCVSSRSSTTSAGISMVRSTVMTVSP
jgi:hypothetical protein